ncbi:hypothetical protein [Streptomyces sp. NPDC059575]|uniref:hypothetical protein n=1 Tax=Streptomyces sp. NPDC059575 TaxID=3346872 RepID=UPI00369257A9
MGARLYDSATGRFLQIDPVTGGGANIYGCPVDPITTYDPNVQWWSWGLAWKISVCAWSVFEFHLGLMDLLPLRGDLLVAPERSLPTPAIELGCSVMHDSILSALALVALVVAILAVSAYFLIALRIWAGRDPRRKTVPVPHFTAASIAASFAGVLVGKFAANTIADIGMTDLKTLWVPILSGAAALTLLELNSKVREKSSVWPRVAVAIFAFLVGLALAAHGGLTA